MTCDVGCPKTAFNINFNRALTPGLSMAAHHSESSFPYIHAIRTFVLVSNRDPCKKGITLFYFSWFTFISFIEDYMATQRIAILHSHVGW